MQDAQQNAPPSLRIPGYRIERRIGPPAEQCLAGMIGIRRSQAD